MLRNFLAGLAIVLLLSVLTLLTVESRSVTGEYYIAHANRVRAIETSKDDLTAVIRGTQSAFDEGRPIPEPVNLTFPRLNNNNQMLQDMLDSLRDGSPVTTQLPVYGEALSVFVSDGQAFADRQNSLAEALRSLQEESPIVVNDLRRYNLGIQSQNAFSLAIDLIEFATGQGGSDVAQLQTRIDELLNDADIDSRVSGRLNDFAKTATLILSEHVAAKTALEKVSKSNIRDQLWTLSDSILNENRRTVGRADRARLLLSICAGLLLAGAAYATLKLQKSYRDLNRSNAELETVNSSLEDRVASRTAELSGAYDDLKESQVQLVQAEKMSSLGELVAGISHEINTPLWYLTSNATVVQERLATVMEFFDIAEKMIAAVSSRSSVQESVTRGLVAMQSMFSDGMKDDVDEAGDLIKDSIEGLEELSELAQSLKDFSRLDRAKHGALNVNEGLDKTLLITKNRIKNKVTVHKHYGEVPIINCSASQINQIFLNLITNAADAIEDTGEIVLRTWQEGCNVCISVGDSGVGIPAELLSKIHDPFFTTKEVGKGTGLGLSIVNQIVASHNGELKVESEPGVGTAFTVILPILSDAEAEVADTNGISGVGMTEESRDNPAGAAVTALPVSTGSLENPGTGGGTIGEAEPEEATA